MEYRLEGSCTLVGGPSEEQMIESLFSRAEGSKVVTFEVTTPDGKIYLNVYLTMLKQDLVRGRESWWFFEGISQSRKSKILGTYYDDGDFVRCGEVFIEQIV
jgi:hypothetical protein